MLSFKIYWWAYGLDPLFRNVSDICDKWKIEKKFLDKRSRMVKIHFDKLSQDEWLNAPEQPFRVTIIYPMIDIILSQLKNRFAGIKDVLDDYRVFQPQFLAHSLLNGLEQKTDEFLNTFRITYPPCFLLNYCVWGLCLRKKLFLWKLSKR